MRSVLILGLLLAFPVQSFAEVLTRIVALGDSLTEGYGNPKSQAYPALLEISLNQNPKWKGRHFEVINAGVSGSTSASGLSRLKWLIKMPPQILILALGANDGLRGLKTTETEKNLANVIELAQSNHVKVLLAGMKMPPNYGKAYTQDFEGIFTRLTKRYHLALIPFLLDRVALHPELNIEDGIHPNAKGQAILAKTVEQYLEPLL